MNIFWSDHARLQIREIFEYISRDSPKAAEGLLEGFLARLDLLAEFPEQGNPVAESGRSDLRQIIYQFYRVVYRVDGDRIYILSVRHTRMNEEQSSEDRGDPG